EQRAHRREKREALKRHKEIWAQKRKKRYIVFYGDATDEDRALVAEYLARHPDSLVLRRPRLEEKGCVYAAESAALGNATLLIPRLACASRRCLDILNMLEATGEFIKVCDLPGASVFVLQIQAALTEYQDDVRFAPPKPATSPLPILAG